MSSLSSLLVADKRCLDTAEVFLESVSDHPSPRGLKCLLSQIEAAQTLARDLRPANKFEVLLGRHLEQSWNGLRALAEFRFGCRPIVELMDGIFGPDSVHRLAQGVAELDDDLAWRYLQCRSSYRSGRISIKDSRAASPAQALTGELATRVRGWFARKASDFPGLDARVTLDLDDTSESSYDPEEHTIVLGGGELMIFSEPGGEIRVNPIVTLRSLFHELGHAIQALRCRELPSPLRPEDRPHLDYASLPSQEGFACFMATQALFFAQDHAEDFSLAPRDLELMDLMVKLTQLHHVVPALLSVYRVRERQDRGFDARSALRRLVGHNGYEEQLLATHPGAIHRLLYDASVFFGFQRVCDLDRELDVRGLPEPERIERLAWGTWALPCLPEAVLEGESLVESPVDPSAVSSEMPSQVSSEEGDRRGRSSSEPTPSSPLLERILTMLREKVDPGYEFCNPGPIPWSSFEGDPKRCRIALVSTGGLHHRDDHPFRALEGGDGDPSYRVIEERVTREELALDAPYVDAKYTPHDPEVALPRNALKDLYSRGDVGPPPSRHYSFCGGVVRPLPGLATSSQSLFENLLADGVDAVVLLPTCSICVQTVCIVARELESKGIPTVALTLLPELSQIVGAPRTLSLRFPFGAPAGDPENRPLHRAVLLEALDHLATATSPGSLRKSELRFRRKGRD